MFRKCSATLAALAFLTSYFSFPLMGDDMLALNFFFAGALDASF